MRMRALRRQSGLAAAIGILLALPVIGTIQIVFANGRTWVGALHGAGAIVVLLLAGAVHVMSMRQAQYLSAR